MPTKTKRSQYTAKKNSVCIRCGETIWGSDDSGHISIGKGHAVHWQKGPASGTGLNYHCNKGCCTCDDPVGLDLRAPLTKDQIVAGGNRGDGGDADDAPSDGGDGQIDAECGQAAEDRQHAAP